MSNNDDTLLDVVLMFNGGPLGAKQRTVVSLLKPERS